MRNFSKVICTLIAVCLMAPLLAGCSKHAKSVRHLRRGDSYYTAGQYPRAEIEYLSALRLAPTNSHAIGRLGTIYFEEGRPARAYAFLVKAVELRPEDVGLRVKLATFYLSSGKAKEAREQANLVLDITPTNSEAPLLLAQSVTTRTNAEAVRLRLEKLAALLGETAPVRLALGTLLLHQGDTNSAEAAFSRAEMLEPKSSAVQEAVGMLRLARNDLKGADIAFKAAADLSPPRSGRRLSYAGFKLKIGEVAEAKRRLASITKQTPDYLPAWIRQAEIAMAERDYTNCASLLNQALARDPGNYETLLLRGRLFLAQRDPAKAIAEFERMRTLYERSPQVHYHLALAHLLNHDESKAIKSLKQATTLAPEFSEAVLLQARLNIARDEPAPAIALLTGLLKRQPRLPQAHLQLAAAYTVKGDLESALAAYRRLGEIYPSNAETPMRMGLIYMQQNLREEARSAFNRTLELSTNHFPAIERLVELDLAAGMFTNALTRARIALDQYPTNAEPHFLLARVHLAQAGKLVTDASEKEAAHVEAAKQFALELAKLPAAQTQMDLAERELLRAVELGPDFQASYLLLARIYSDTGKNQMALEQLRAELARRTNDIPALILMAAIQLNEKNYSEARATYERMLTVSPESALALNNLADLYSEHFGLLDKAYEMANKARNLVASKADTPGSATGGPQSQKARSVAAYQAYTAGTLGWILFKRGEYQRALSLLQESAEKMGAERFPGEAEERFHLGMAYYMLGQEDRARKAFNRALSLNEDFVGKDEVSRHLALLSIDVKTVGPADLVKLERQLQDTLGDPVLAARIGSIYERDGKPEKALQTYEAVLKQNSKNVAIMLRQALLQAGPLHNTQRALELAKTANKLAPDDPEVSAALGRMALTVGDPEWALGLLQQSSRQRPEDAELRYDLAWAYHNVGRLAEAEAALHGVLQAERPFSRADEARRFLEMLELSSSPERAISGEQKARELLQGNPGYVPALMVAALCSEKRGEATAARVAYEQALKQIPNFSPAMKKLAGLYEELGQPEKAYEMANKAYAALPNDAETAKTLGIVLYGRQDYRNSARLLDESSRKGSADAKAMYYLGMAHFQLSKEQKDRVKEQTESKKSLQRALDLNLQANLADDAKRVLTALK
jgi:tetratricopeptide (TPR) repeat protein